LGGQPPRVDIQAVGVQKGHCFNVGVHSWPPAFEVYIR
jgi:hypothetical protein